MKRILILFSVLSICCHDGKAQGEIPVNFYTGTPQIFVDLYSVADHDLSENLQMTYDANSASPFGYGWSLHAGGMISRKVRGLPDDFADATRTGWLYNNNYANVLNFPNSSDASTATYADELADYNYIAGLQYLKDTEPDLFTFSVGGFSGKFMFNNNGAISLIPYQDIVITPVYSGTAPAIKTIIGWTIKTNTGITYTLNDVNTVTRTLSKSDTKYSNQETSLSLFDRDYNLYKTAVNYTFSWMLSTAQSFTGSKLTYTYTTPTTSTVTRSKTAEIIEPEAFNASIGVEDVLDLMDETTTVVSKSLSMVTANNGPWAVINGTANVTIFEPTKSLTIPFKTFTFTYQADHPDLLSSIVESTPCASMPPYQFTYNTPPVVNAPPLDQFNEYYLPKGIQQDLWGYSNGQTYSFSQQQFPTIYVYPDEPASERYRYYRIPNYVGKEIILNGNSNRNPNGHFPTLSRIIYPAGGETDLTYESNQYRDGRSGLDANAGGVRISGITYYDGINPLSKIVKSFSYADDAGNSSGKLLVRPLFAVPVWEYLSPTFNGAGGRAQIIRTYDGGLSAGTTKNLWQCLTMVTNFDMNDEGSESTIVGYTQVTVYRSGSGKAVYNYYVPGAFGDAATGSGATDWSPTVMKLTRPSNISASILQSSTGGWIHPAFPFQMYDYEQGLVWKKAEFDESNKPVRTTLTTYQYLFQNGASPTTIKALAYDKFANGSPTSYLFSSYQQLADLGKVIASETVTTYDNTIVPARSITQTTQNQYTSAYHRYLSRVNTTTPDGTVYGTSFQYVQDYPYTGTPTDSTMWMIKLLNDQRRTGTVVEQVNTMQVSGGTEKTTGASLVLYRPVSVNGQLTPFVKWQMNYRPDVPGAFTKSSSSGNVFNRFNDTHYQTVNTINEYDAFGLPISSTNESRATSGTLWGYGQRQPVATFSQARSISIGFSDFETTTVSSFTVAPATKYTGTGRTGVNGVHPYASLTRTVVKPDVASTYVLSFWAKPAAGNTSLSLVVSLNGTNTTYTFNYKTGVSDYQYFTKAIDVSAMPSTFTVSISGSSFLTQPSSSSPSLLPLLDDVGFYPDYATISSVTYQIPYGANSATSATGITSYTTYDSLGRVVLLLDQNHYIRQRYTYGFTGQVVPTLSATIGGYTTYYVNTSFNFAGGSNPCINNVSYAWDFENQNLFASGGQQGPTLSYLTPGTHSVTLRVSHPDYGQKTTTLNYSIINPPPPGLGVTINETVNGNMANFTSTVTGDDGDTGITYQWKTRDTGTQTWLVRATTPTYSQKLIVGKSVDVMCTITTSGLQTADSYVLVVSY
jgi:hypothetical protein